MGVGIGLRGTARDGFAGRFRETRDVSWMDAGRFADGGGTTSCAYMLNSIILRKIVDGGGSSTETRPGFGARPLSLLSRRPTKTSREGAVSIDVEPFPV
jgi:hypothetical protein